jgi:hypothetical protein
MIKIIPACGVNGLAEYVEKKHIVVPRPDECGNCRKKGSLWKHGCFERWAIEAETEVLLRIQRFLCPACGATTSCLFEFLVPYRRFTVAVIAQGVSSYASAQTTYRGEAVGLSKLESSDTPKPSHCQVFRWVRTVCDKVQIHLLQAQKTMVMTGRADELEQLRRKICPNSDKAKSIAKSASLNLLAELNCIAELIFADDGLAALHAHLLQSVEALQAIFAGHAFELVTPQRAKHLIF